MCLGLNSTFFSRFTTSSTRALTSHSTAQGVRLLPISCSLRVMPLARLAAVSITESSLQMASGLWSSSNSGLSMSRMTPLVAMIIASGLLISWATPAASSPMEASLEAWASISWSCWPFSAMRRALLTSFLMVKKIMAEISRLMAIRLMVSTRRALIMPAWATATGCIASSAQGVSLSQAWAISMV